MIGENDDTGPINPVRFMFPKFPSRKSIAPSAINEEFYSQIEKTLL